METTKMTGADDTDAKLCHGRAVAAASGRSKGPGFANVNTIAVRSQKCNVLDTEVSCGGPELNRRTIAWFGLICLALGACAHMPDVRVAYFLPKAEITVDLTQTITCSFDGSRSWAAYDVKPTVSYMADRGEAPRYFSYPQHDSWLADSDITIKLTDDGRLTMLNSMSHAQSEAIVAAAVELGTAVSNAAKPRNSGVSALQGSKLDPKQPKLCDGLIENGKSISIRYNASFSYPEQNKAACEKNRNAVFKLASGHQEIGKDLQKFRIKIPTLSLSSPIPVASIVSPDTDATVLPVHPGEKVCLAEPPAQTDRPAARAGNPTADPSGIQLRGIDAVTMTISIEDDEFRNEFLVPSRKPDIFVPVPSSRLFGTMITTLEVGESGAVKTIGYNKATGATTFLAALAAIITFGATR